jgi:hypothetical protein
MTPEWRQAISWILAGLFGLICLIGWEIWSSRTFRFRRANSINWDISINDALDYIVNDSTETFPPPPTMGIRGMSIPATGTQHQAALSRVNQKLTSGDLDISGHKEIIPKPAPRLYEEVRRRIDQKYWELALLHPLNCFHYTTQLPQTYIMSGDSYPTYYNLKMNIDQLQRVWPRSIASPVGTVGSPKTAASLLPWLPLTPLGCKQIRNYRAPITCGCQTGTS